MEKSTLPRTSRASALLPASGDWDASPTALPLDAHTTTCTAWVTYARGADGGRVAVRAEISPDGERWYATTIGAGSLTPAGPVSTMELAVLVYLGPVPDDDGELRFAVSFDTAGARHIRLLASEAGVTATPGTVAISISQDAS